ncbi:MAG: hypothetical protein GF416_05150 [Candidatus Altiarchaeales archaeon]|nr:hypothetical protein [Candidatus Altiarchaeales archaeon]MBD3416503.1 hypothetical protein [Candidatus Altiarchaeales archaeon]
MVEQEKGGLPDGPDRRLAWESGAQFRGQMGTDLNEIRRESIIAFIAPKFDQHGLRELRLPITSPHLVRIGSDAMPQFVKGVRETIEREGQFTADVDDITPVIGRLLYRTKVPMDEDMRRLFYEGRYGGILHSEASVERVNTEDVTVAQALQLSRWLHQTGHPAGPSLNQCIINALGDRLSQRSTYNEGSGKQHVKPVPYNDILPELSAIACDASIRAHVRGLGGDSWGRAADISSTGDPESSVKAGEYLMPCFRAAVDTSNELPMLIELRGGGKVVQARSVLRGMESALAHSVGFGPSCPLWYLALLRSTQGEFTEQLQQQGNDRELADGIWARLERPDVTIDGIPRLTSSIVVGAQYPGEVSVEEVKDHVPTVFRIFESTLRTGPTQEERMWRQFAEAIDRDERKTRVHDNVYRLLGSGMEDMIGFAEDRDSGKIGPEKYDRLMESNALSVAVRSLGLDEEKQAECIGLLSRAFRMRQLRRKLIAGEVLTPRESAMFREDMAEMGEEHKGPVSLDAVNGGLGRSMTRMADSLDPYDYHLYTYALDLISEQMSKDPRRWT